MVFSFEPEGETQQNILAQKMGRKDRPFVPKGEWGV